MSSGPPPRTRPVVVKVGGGLVGVPGALEAACAAIERLATKVPVVVLPGGGPLAHAVRELQRQVQATDDAAHWMAILAMDQLAHVLAERIGGAVLVEEPGGLGSVLESGGVPVLGVYRWMRAADVLPHSWNATSDSIAAFVAGAVDARQLLLIKPVAGERSSLVDPCFESVLPVGLAWTAVAWDKLEEMDRIHHRGTESTEERR